MEAINPACGAGNGLGNSLVGSPNPYALQRSEIIGAMTKDGIMTPIICMICNFHGVEPKMKPDFKSCRLSPPTF